jgi:hypothetical protein
LDIKSVEDVLRLHQDLEKRLGEYIDKAAKGWNPSPEEFIRDSERLLELERARRTKAIRTKEAVVRRCDADIASCDEAINRLTAEIREARKRASKPAPKKEMQQEAKKQRATTSTASSTRRSRRPGSHR